MTQRLRRLCLEIWCVINGGHVDMYYFDDSHICLRCHMCGRRSPGVDVRHRRLHFVREEARRGRERW
jgi:hypothetical protein